VADIDVGSGLDLIGQKLESGLTIRPSGAVCAVAGELAEL
jgi:hypothetical protein